MEEPFQNDVSTKRKRLSRMLFTRNRGVFPERCSHEMEEPFQNAVHTKWKSLSRTLFTRNGSLSRTLFTRNGRAFSERCSHEMEEPFQNAVHTKEMEESFLSVVGVVESPLVTTDGTCYS